MTMAVLCVHAVFAVHNSDGNPLCTALHCIALLCNTNFMLCASQWWHYTMYWTAVQCTAITLHSACCQRLDLLPLCLPFFLMMGRTKIGTAFLQVWCELIYYINILIWENCCIQYLVYMVVPVYLAHSLFTM